jgi:DNA-binding IclR family transcriptional regulator
MPKGRPKKPLGAREVSMTASYKEISGFLLAPGPRIEDKTVKSARRTMELCEFFAEHQQPANILTIAEALDFPASSTAALVKSLVALGYLHHDRVRRTYFPTLRNSLLGEWLRERYFQDNGVLHLMNTIAQETHATVLLAMQSGVHVQYLMVIDGNDDMRAYARIGSLRPICRASTGKMLLTLASPQTIRGIVLRANSVEKAPENRVRLTELIADLENCRDRGYATTYGSVTSGRGTVGMLIPTLQNHVPLAIGVGGSLQRMDAEVDDWIAVMRKHLANTATVPRRPVK